MTAEVIALPRREDAGCHWRVGDPVLIDGDLPGTVAMLIRPCHGETLVAVRLAPGDRSIVRASRLTAAVAT